MSIRTTAPNTDNKYYITTAGGGYNKCIPGNANNVNKARPTKYFVMPNCVGYAYGRYLEYWKLKSANLPTGNANTWDDTAKKNGFKVLNTPSVGSVAVFEGTKYGHVAFVEEVRDDGSVLLSESNWSGRYFRNVVIKKSNNYGYSSTLKCVGFITNPNIVIEPPKPQSPEPPQNNKYTIGDYRVKADKLRVRTGAGSSYQTVKFEQLTKSAQKKVLKLNGEPYDGYVKGIEFTVYELHYNQKDGYTWGRTPSGWVALDYCVKI